MYIRNGHSVERIPDIVVVAVVDDVVVIGGQCEEGACRNGGRCLSQMNGVVCDCDMTSFTGPTCADGILYTSIGISLSLSLSLSL